jgi:hypothetical protein
MKKVTRFCPTLYPGKEIHLGHLLSLAITRRWAAENDADFFYLIEIAEMAQMPTWGTEALGGFKGETIMLEMVKWGSRLNVQVVQQVAILQQLVPAPVRFTISQTVEDVDKAMGTTHLFRGSHCPGTTNHEDRTEFRLPMLTHPVFGYISRFTHCGRYTMAVMTATLIGQYAAFAKAIAYFWEALGITESPLDMARITRKETLTFDTVRFRDRPDVLEVGLPTTDEVQCYNRAHRLLKI